jgi:PAS domain S-box-containing protein
MKHLAISNEIFCNVINHLAEGVVIVEASKEKDNPIIFVNEGFSRITGYNAEEVIGKNPRFLQGKETHPDTVAHVRKLINEQKRGSVLILNYKKDGTPFWNYFTITPLFDNSGKLKYWFGLERDVSKQIEELKKASANNSLSTMINTFNDLVNNSLNYLLYLKEDCEKIVSPHSPILTEFNEAYENFLHDFQKLTQIAIYKNQAKGGEDFSSFDYK